MKNRSISRQADSENKARERKLAKRQPRVRQGFSASRSFPETSAKANSTRRRQPAVPLHTPEFSIVGVGVFAVGLETFTNFLDHLPRETGLMFVLVRNRGSMLESKLAALRGRTTTMPVVEPRKAMRIAPDRLYAILPNRGWSWTTGDSSSSVSIPKICRERRRSCADAIRGSLVIQRHPEGGTEVACAITRQRCCSKRRRTNENENQNHTGSQAQSHSHGGRPSADARRSGAMD